MNRPRQPLLALPLLIAAATGLTACDKEAGRKQEVVGHVESGVGKVLGDEDLQQQGKGDKVAGDVKQGDLGDAVKDLKD